MFFLKIASLTPLFLQFRHWTLGLAKAQVQVKVKVKVKVNN